VALAQGECCAAATSFVILSLLYMQHALRHAATAGAANVSCTVLQPGAHVVMVAVSVARVCTCTWLTMGLHGLALVAVMWEFLASNQHVVHAHD
jgi:hypothetical protein